QRRSRLADAAAGSGHRFRAGTGPAGYDRVRHPYRSAILGMSQRIRKAVFPVAGLGTRFLPATKAMAKEMLPVVDKPLIQYAVDEARAAGIEQFCLVTGRGKTAIVEHFDIAFELEATLRQRSKEAELKMLNEAQLPPGSIVTVRQQEPLGLGHAIWCARAFVGDDPFAILLPD